VGVAGMLAWRRNGRRWSPALLAWAVATALVVCWPLAFMNGRLCLPVGAFCGMLAVTAAATAATALLLHERLLVPAVLMLALLCWLLFASLLSFLSIP
jgi:tryptophan-rich sensory protein